MADYKGMLAELAELATEEQAMFTIYGITKSDEAITERKYNQMINEEVR